MILLFRICDAMRWPPGSVDIEFIKGLMPTNPYCDLHFVNLIKYHDNWWLEAWWKSHFTGLIID